MSVVLNIMSYPLQVQFSFKGSKKSNNGTDVNAGQIPQILYRIVTQVQPRRVVFLGEGVGAK